MEQEIEQEFLRSIPKFVSSNSIAKAVNIFLIITIILGVVSIINEFIEIGLLTRIKNNGYYTETEAEANDLRILAISSSGIIISLITATLFIYWFYLSHRNLKALGNRHLEYSPKWAIGGFLVPFLNLVRPYQVMKEIWIKSNPDINNEVIPVSPIKQSGWELVKLWWFLFLFSNFLPFVALRFWSQEESIDNYIMGDWISISSDIISIVAAIITIRLINRIVRNQNIKHEKMGLLAREESTTT